MRKLVIAALTAAVLVAMGGLRVADLRWSRAETLQAAESRAANLARILSEYLAGAFAAGDASLRQLALHSRRVGGPEAPAEDWGPSLASARAGLTTTGAISVVDRDGIIRHSTRPEIVNQSRRNDFVIREALGVPGDNLVVGTPFPAVVAPGGLLIPIARRLTGADGQIEGVIVASFIPAQARQFFHTVDVGAHGTIWVFHPDGVVLFREPSAADPIGEPAGRNPIFAAAARGSTGVLYEPLTEGGPISLTAFQKGGGPPLIVAISLERDEVLAEWRHEAMSSAAIFGVVALTLATTLFVLFRQMDAKAAAERELTHARQIEAERLREANQQLAAALAREQSARQDAETASALKDQFLMTVSHELRTPLTAIYGWARMLIDGTVSDRAKDAALRTIERNAQAQRRLIDDLLDVSSAVNGRLRLDVRDVEIAEVVQNALETVNPAAEAKGIRVETLIERAAGRVRGDPERLQQIAWNLLSNAVKFTPNGGRVKVAVRRMGNEVAITVSDTGVGIAPAFLPHVFERFRQADGGTTRSHGGLGIGLAIVRSLAELHGGSVSGHSAGEGKGATFTVRLPSLVLRPAADTEPVAGAGAAAKGPTSRLTGVRVLVVDDDPTSCELFATILSVAGADVTMAASAFEALASLRRASYEVLLSDVEMPSMDGYALVHEAMAIADARADHLIAIAVTAYSRPEDEARSKEAGFHYHIRKPVDPDLLVAVVSSLVTVPLPRRGAL